MNRTSMAPAGLSPAGALPYARRHESEQPRESRPVRDVSESGPHALPSCGERAGVRAAGREEPSFLALIMAALPQREAMPPILFMPPVFVALVGQRGDPFSCSIRNARLRHASARAVSPSASWAFPRDSQISALSGSISAACSSRSMAFS